VRNEHTIAVCFYGNKAASHSCLDAIRHIDSELILVDDGSPDDTWVRLEVYRAANPDQPIRLVRHARNLGLSEARNTAINAAQGAIIYFTSSDCAPDPDWVARLSACFDDPDVVAASGTTLDHPPRTLAEAAFTRSTYLPHGQTPGRKLVGNNMAFRRSILLLESFDPALRLYCDEDELAWRLTELGYKIAFAKDAIVRHDHPLTIRQYLRQARQQGQGSARFWYKQGKYIGRDILPVTLALLSLPLGFLSLWLLLVPAFFATAQLGALVYNQHALKGKTLGTAVKVLPVEIAYSACKTTSVYLTLLRILLGYEPAIVQSKREWRNRRKSRGDGRPAEGEGGEQLRDDGRG